MHIKQKDPEAQEIYNIFRMYKKDATLYLKGDEESLDALFDAVIAAIDASGAFKLKIPYQEFVHPAKEVMRGDKGWVGHFNERDNRRFYLSDVYDYLSLFYEVG